MPLGELSSIEIMKMDIDIAFSENCYIASKMADCTVTKRLTEWVVVLKTQSDVILEETHKDLRNTTKTESKHAAFISFLEEPLAKRVSEGLKHATDLCRGTEPF